VDPVRGCGPDRAAFAVRHAGLVARLETGAVRPPPGRPPRVARTTRGADAAHRRPADWPTTCRYGPVATAGKLGHPCRENSARRTSRAGGNRTRPPGPAVRTAGRSAGPGCLPGRKSANARDVFRPLTPPDSGRDPKRRGPDSAGRSVPKSGWETANSPATRQTADRPHGPRRPAWKIRPQIAGAKSPTPAAARRAGREPNGPACRGTHQCSRTRSGHRPPIARRSPADARIAVRDQDWKTAWRKPRVCASHGGSFVAWSWYFPGSK